MCVYIYKQSRAYVNLLKQSATAKPSSISVGSNKRANGWRSPLPW